MASRESASSWKEFLLSLKQRGLKGVEMVVSDDHAGLKKAIAEVIPEAVWQRCYVHFLRNALDHLPRKAIDDCLQELRWLYTRPTSGRGSERPGPMAGALGKKYPKLCERVEEIIGETLTSYRLPLQHHKHMKSTKYVGTV